MTLHRPTLRRPFARLIALKLAVMAVIAAVALPSIASAKCRPGTQPVVLQSSAVAWGMSPCRAGAESIKLLEGQFLVDEDRAGKGTPQWARGKYAPGQLELIDSYDSKWDPFRAAIAGLKYDDLEVTVVAKDGTKTPKRYDSLDELFGADERFGVVAKTKDTLTFVWPDPARIKSPVYLARTYQLVPDAPYQLDATTEVWNLGDRPLKFAVQHTLTAYRDPNAESGGLFEAMSGPADQKGAGFNVAGETVHFDTTELSDEDPEDRARAGVPKWLMTDSRYFTLAELPGKGWRKGSSVHVSDVGNGVVQSVLRSQGESLSAAKGGCVPTWYAEHWQGTTCVDDFKTLGLQRALTEEIPEPFIEAARRKGSADAAATNAAIDRVQHRRVFAVHSRLFAGPKRLELLSSTGEQLEEAIDFGWFGAIARPLLWILKQAQGLTGSWPLAILILTVMIKGLLWPITGKSLKSMKKMQMLKPELDRIKTKLEEEARRAGEERPDPNKLNQETFALYKRHGVNPLGGCLPMFIQMPVYISLYRTIYASVELYNQPLFLWIDDLTKMDPYFALPLLLGAAMFVQTRLTPQTSGDETQRKVMMWVMPIMFTVMMAWLPSGLTLYILVNTVLSSVQTVLLHRKEEFAAAA